MKEIRAEIENKNAVEDHQSYWVFEKMNKIDKNFWQVYPGERENAQITHTGNEKVCVTAHTNGCYEQHGNKFQNLGKRENS